MRIGLALSGGGFRATLFHLGVLAALRHRGVLQRVTEVSGVSGGAIMAAHLVQRWGQYTGTPQEFDREALKIVQLCQRNVRGKVLMRRFASRLSLIPLMLRSAGTGALLEHQYRTALFQQTRFSDLPVAPHLSILATSLTTGQMVAYESDGWRAFPSYPDLECELAVNNEYLSRGVAASAAFPILSPPYPLAMRVRKSSPPTAAQQRLPDQLDLQLTDGGVYDNLGALWLAFVRSKYLGNSPDLLLISNAGRPFQWRLATDPPASILERSQRFRRNMRANDLLTWRLEEYDLTRIKGLLPGKVREFRIDQRYMPTGNAPSESQQQAAANIRTDLNRFSYRECQLLRRHGACVALDELTRQPIRI